jgi:hypothetical protein
VEGVVSNDHPYSDSSPGERAAARDYLRKLVTSSSCARDF